MEKALELTAIIAPFVTLLAGWLVGRRNSNLEALEKEMDFYRKLITDLKDEMEELRKEMVELSDQNRDLIEHNEQLKAKIDSMKREMQQLQTQLKKQ